ncbi:MAG: LrgB family protein [Bradyrhizobium sp.]|jgi:predicted murein hydrolase (TIGR00659 family)|uniref:LrgB family protein n=2 Tax=Bradyrhizobium TaxID=374 RepID=A0ABS5GAZ4_9BRAD|nr:MULTISPECIES: LrgB family protein [Bradyrhizobium]RTM03740.1 MAG: LrgB family protein [Bradyrhizobiaceae bacterium]ABQ39090.1 Putative Murein hydrolase export regulator, LrgB family protein [Bradyrhizobium sp. BTAi1]MBR1137776.1 LrgB family protein [Bradyrhizobium denitrificans]MCL8487849.1 LrgB family protein [Bradyrhizobium denitrificans]MDU1495168.1 LrgB family protein [Bradyrhizobium sp.]
MTLAALWREPLVQAAVWSLATILLYLLAKRVHRRWPRWWLMPLAVAPALLMIAALALNVSYRDYIRGTHWLVALLGPATVAFAVPIYEQRALIRRRWPLLLAGMVAGSLTAVATSWALAYVLGIDGELRLSLLPRSMSTPFAMEVSGEIGGIPDLTAVFVVLTGIIGAAVGDIVLARLPLRSTLAKGALFGVGAHGAGTARAHQIGREEGAIAGLVMVLVGLMNVALAPLIIQFMK